VKERKAKRAISRRRSRRARAKSAQSVVKVAPRGEALRHAGASPKGARRPRNDNFLVVGLGASAGGLEAVRKLLAALPADTGMAFVLIQHLDPTHESMMVDLLARNTAMKVMQATDAMSIEHNCLYVIPPQYYLSIHNGLLRLSEPQAHRGARLPFDFFLHSLADQYGERAVCVILSGTGADGSIGLKAVSEKGGLVIAQDPEEAAYDGMPRNAVATGAVNLVLPAARIPRALISYAQHPYVTVDRKAVPRDDETDKSLAAIVNLLRSRTSHDFSRYKQSTLLRRISRRMAAAGIEDLEGYFKALRKDGRELDLLAKDLFVHVTSFFRDPTAYEALAKAVIPELVRQHVGNRPIRIWVPGCSTGEEAYSLAMLFFEEFAAVKRNLKLQIFASDASADAVAYGRNGIYPESIAADIPAERLARFFTREDHSYRVSRDLRDAITFTVQDLLVDPPFLHLDFISCRNLLIYLQPDEQEKVLLLFLFALQPGGILFLGTAETIGKLTDRFEPVSNTLRTFRRLGAVSHASGWAMIPNIGERVRSLLPRVTGHAELKPSALGELAQRLLLEIYAPAAVLVNRKYQGLYFFGPIDRYLHVAAGAPSRYLPTMLREGLASKLRAAVAKARQSHAAATISGARVNRNGASAVVSITARPIQHEGEELLLVNFVDEPEQKAVRTIESPAEASRVEQLEQELETTRKELESAIQELEASNQELSSLNEEAVSVNEEFQSTNEELETSREELQSLNEELTTVNA
jgi:two-component system CheB/CheR fusion protein